MGEKPTEGSENEFSYTFNHCIIRTPVVETEDSVHFVSVEYENPEDTTSAGMKNFVLIDTDKLRYDFHLRSESAAIDKADPNTSTTSDHDGMPRSEKPDVGAYEYRDNDKNDEK